MVLTGYPPEDLLLRPRFIQEQQAVFERLCQDLAGLAGLHVVIGHVLARQDRLYNAATVVCEGRVLGSYCKRELPNYSVFDEQRYFSAHGEAFGFTVKGVRFGLNICEDIWFERAPRAAAADGAQVLLVPNASPYNTGKQEERLSVARRSVQDTGCALIYANLVGGQDELVFDGASFALDAQGRMSARLPDFTEGVNVLEVDARSTVRPVTEQAAVQPTASKSRSGTRWCWACATTWARTAFPAPSSACRAASIRPWCWRWRSTPWARTTCARS